MVALAIGFWGFAVSGFRLVIQVNCFIENIEIKPVATPSPEIINDIAEIQYEFVEILPVIATFELNFTKIQPVICKFVHLTGNFEPELSTLWYNFKNIQVIITQIKPEVPDFVMKKLYKETEI